MDATIGMTQFGGAAVVVFLMQKLKDWDRFPWLQNAGRVWLKRVISIGAAFGIHTGISHVWNPGVVAGSGILMLTIPPPMVIAEGLWHWFCQYAMQESLYQATVNKVSVTTDSTGSIPARVAPDGAMVVPAAVPHPVPSPGATL